MKSKLNKYEGKSGITLGALALMTMLLGQGAWATEERRPSSCEIKENTSQTQESWNHINRNLQRIEAQVRAKDA
jgi:hypothetical protein